MSRYSRARPPDDLRVQARDLRVQERVGRGDAEPRDRHADADELGHLPAEEKLVEVELHQTRVVRPEAEQVVPGREADERLLEPDRHSGHPVVHEGHDVPLPGLQGLATDRRVQVVSHPATPHSPQQSKAGAAFPRVGRPPLFSHASPAPDPVGPALAEPDGSRLSARGEPIGPDPRFAAREVSRAEAREEARAAGARASEESGERSRPPPASGRAARRCAVRRRSRAKSRATY